MTIALKHSLSMVTAVAALLSVSDANAEVCGANGHPVVYVAGTVKPYVSAVARALYNDPDPITIVYKGVTSCLGIDAVLNSTAIAGTTASYFDPASSAPGNEVTCDLPSADAGAGATFADIGSSDVFAPTCFALPNGLPSSVRDAFGPVQTMGFVVPSASPERSISANAAYLIFGLGADVANIKPWLDPAFVYKRNESSGTSLLIGTGLGLPARKWKNTDPLFSSAAVTALTTSSSPGKTMGVLAKTDITDTLSTQLQMLAYKDFKQSCAYYPDAAANSKDKQNVRDGHYVLWGPTHFYVKVDGAGNITNPKVARVIGILTGSSVPPSGLNLIQVDEVNNLVPTCAMKVQRSSEMGTMTPFAPINSCSCYYDELATGKNSCSACTSSSTCPASAPTCSAGFCEPQ